MKSKKHYFPNLTIEMEFTIHVVAMKLEPRQYSSWFQLLLMNNNFIIKHTYKNSLCEIN